MFDQLRSRLLNRLSKIQERSRALDTVPTAPIDTLSQGNALIQAGRFVEAERTLRGLLAARPADAKVLVNLGFVLKEQRRLTEARVYLQRAILLGAAEPPLHEIHYLFGSVAEEQGSLEEATNSYGKAFSLKADFEYACKDYCRLLFLTGKRAEAQAVLEAGLQLNPDSPVFLFFQGNLHAENHASDLAVQSYSKALKSGGNDAAVYSALGVVLYRLGQVDAALDNFRLAEAREPGCVANAQYQSGRMHFDAGDLANAVVNFEIAIKFNPQLLKAHSMLLCSLSFNPDGPVSYRDAALRYDAVLSAQAATAQRPPRTPYAAGGRALRVGFVSADLKAHPVGLFLEGILRQFDRTRIHAIAYVNNASNDRTTERLKAQFAEWHDIRQLDDDAAAQLVRAHQIDILVDLTGHTGDNRLPVFARRPAPVQVAWLGYFASTGVTQIDYILADDVSVPQQSTEYFSEKVWYLPDTRLCMTVPEPLPPVAVAPAPALVNGFTTFGSFQTRTKINLRVLSVWARVLAAVPGSRLRLQIPQIDIPANAADLRQQLQQAGISQDRVALHAGVSWEQYLGDYAEVDILLDTFPFPGGTTTAEALWMGVPTVTLAGSTMLSQQGASILSCVGLQDWIARDDNDYVAKAVSFASDAAALNALRGGLRERAAASPLFDSRRFAAHLQHAFESMYLTPRHA